MNRNQQSVPASTHAREDESSRSKFNQLHKDHWAIEEYYRGLKQLCNIERFQVRDKQQVRNHIFAAIFGYTCLEAMKLSESLRSIYSIKKDALKDAIWDFIKSFSEGKN